MKRITNKEYEEWQKYKAEKAEDHVLLPDTVRFICEANGSDAEKIHACGIDTSEKMIVGGQFIAGINFFKERFRLRYD